MTKITRLSHIQNVVDAIATIALAIAGVSMIIGFARPPSVTRTLLHVGTLVWASALAASALITLAGIILRTDKPGTKQAVGYGFEIAGWGFTTLCVLLYTMANSRHGGSAAGDAALIALTALLFGKFLRLVAAVDVARGPIGSDR